MRRSRSWATVAVAATVLGCGLGPGESTEGDATLTVTRDYGSERLLEAAEADPPASRTVIGMLDSAAEITTRYGGGFVQSIDGLEGSLDEGRTRDWFFFVNGIESSSGAGEVNVRGGDRIWWDYRDWTDALRIPAVVGSWPEPFAQESLGSEAAPVTIECRGAAAVCEEVGARLDHAGVEASTEKPADGEVSRADGPRLLVGSWEEIGGDAVAGLLDQGPQTSGVFARFEDGALITLDSRAEPAGRLRAGSGLVAGLRRGSEPPTWLVTGTDAAGVERAAELLEAEHLADRYAVAVTPSGELALPVQARRRAE